MFITFIGCFIGLLPLVEPETSNTELLLLASLVLTPTLLVFVLLSLVYLAWFVFRVHRGPE
jgi:hypothetical protein